MAKILIIEDNETLREGMKQITMKMGHEPFTAPSGEVGLQLFARHSPDFTITDLKMEQISGMEVIREIRKADEEALVMVVTAYGTIETAVEAMKLGAFDFITKPFPPDVLRLKIEKALSVGKLKKEHVRLKDENYSLKEAFQQHKGREIIGNSQAMQRIFQTINKVSRADSTVYIYGESGTGKELIAEAIHGNSSRANGPLIKINCGALPETLLESELFGHEKGSFTGAIRRKIGRFELAHKGSIFLDEIGDVSANIQLKLLRVLQERTFERVGGEETVEVDVRVICATNKDLVKEVEAGRFRQDLFYRLHVIPITIPPLRERAEDIPILVKHFIHKIGPRTNPNIKSISDAALAQLQVYSWPGNIRELENAIEQILVFAEGTVINVADLPPHVQARERENMLSIPEGERTLTDVLEDLERQLILRAYEKAQGKKTETARLLGIKTSALYYKLEKYGLRVEGTEEEAS